jgi:hypothetical protein
LTSFFRTGDRITDAWWRSVTWNQPWAHRSRWPHQAFSVGGASSVETIDRSWMMSRPDSRARTLESMSSVNMLCSIPISRSTLVRHQPLVPQNIAVSKASDRPAWETA